MASQAGFTDHGEVARISGKLDTDKRLLSLGEAIRARRQRARLSQEALADAAGVDRSHMGKIERGERNVTTLLLLDVAAAMDVTLASLFRDAGL